MSTGEAVKRPGGSAALCPPTLPTAVFVISFSPHSGVNGRHDVIMKKSLVLLALGFSVTLAAFAQQTAKNDFDGKTLVGLRESPRRRQHGRPRDW